MPFTPYALPARAVGTSNRIAVEDPNQAILFSHFHDRAIHDAVEVPVTLLPDPRGGGFKVKWDFGVIGTLPAEFREQFPQLERVTGSQLTPQVTAEVRVVPNAGLGVVVLLVDPQWCVPVNDPLDEPWTLLPPGRALELDPAVGGDVGTDELAALGTVQLLVELVEVDGRVTVLHDGRVLGVATRWDSLKLSDALAHFAALGLRVMARAFVGDGAVSVECARTSDLDDGDLEPEISPLPPLAVPADPTGPEGAGVPDLSEAGVSVGADGSWSVHMPSNSFGAVTPARAESHRRRSIVSPAQRRDETAGKEPVAPEREAADEAPADKAPVAPALAGRAHATEVIRVVEDDDLPDAAGPAKTAEPVQGIPRSVAEARRARGGAHRADRQRSDRIRWSGPWWIVVLAVVVLVTLALIVLLG